MTEPLKIAYSGEHMAAAVNQMESLVVRLEKIFGPDLTEAQRQAQYIAVWHSGDDDDAYESIDWDFVIRTLSTTA